MKCDILNNIFATAELRFYLCVKGDEGTCYPATEYPTSRKVQSHLCWLIKTTSEANFVLFSQLR